MLTLLALHCPVLRCAVKVADNCRMTKAPLGFPGGDRLL